MIANIKVISKGAKAHYKSGSWGKKLLKLVWGAMGEASEDVHTLISILAECRVRTLALWGEPPALYQLSLQYHV